MTDDKYPARSYPDLHDHLKELDARGLLVTVDREINKDTEIHPLVRWQFRGGIEEKDRKAFLFNNVVDSKGGNSMYPLRSVCSRRVEISIVPALVANSTKLNRLGKMRPQTRSTRSK